MMKLSPIAVGLLFLTGSVFAADQLMPTQAVIDQVAKDHAMPSDASIADETRNLQPKVKRSLDRADAIKKGGNKIDVPTMPGMSLPEYAKKRPDMDLGKMAEYFDKMKEQNQASLNNKPSELMVFVSFSMPPESLRRIIIQTTDAGGTVFFRGPVDGTSGNPLSFKETHRRLGMLNIRQKIDVAIHPPAFKQFEIDQVPTFVVTDGAEAGKVAENGCAEPRTYLKIAGEVSTEVALREMKKRTQDKKFQSYIDDYLTHLNTVK